MNLSKTLETMVVGSTKKAINGGFGLFFAVKSGTLAACVTGDCSKATHQKLRDENPEAFR